MMLLEPVNRAARLREAQIANRPAEYEMDESLSESFAKRNSKVSVGRTPGLAKRNSKVSVRRPCPPTGSVGRREVRMTGKTTAPAIRARKGGDKITMITAYDAPSATIADRAGVDMILVGDSLANVILGHETTLAVTMDVMIHHTGAVTRTSPNALVIGDMPWLSYHVSIEETVRNAGRFVQEGGAAAVKLEGGEKRLSMIKAVLNAEIPVMGHLGLTPQSVHAMGGYRAQGRDIEAAQELLQDAKALDAVGVFAIVLEGVPDLLARMITTEVSVPTIGIGAGPDCDGWCWSSTTSSACTTAGMPSSSAATRRCSTMP